MPDFAVSDTGPLISLEKMRGGHDFIRRLYGKIVIPPAVLHEVARGKFPSPEGYLRSYEIENFIEIVQPPATSNLPEMERLQTGEAEAISLALKLKCPLLIEETLGRKIASAAGLKISGIAGQIIKGFRQGIIDQSEANQKLKELLSGGRINQKIFEALRIK